jgi:transaldolase
MTLRFYIDSADPGNWERFLRRGWVFGVTTNPVILRREGRSVDRDTYRSLAEEARGMGLEEIHIQAFGSSAEELYASGMFIAELGDHVRVKVPLVPAGLEAANDLAAENAPLTLTAAYAAHQMVVAMALGAGYIAPYYGRLIEANLDGDAILARMRTIRDHNKGSTRILIAALRSVDQVENLLLQGHDTFTLGPAIADSLATDRLSEAAFSEFTDVASAA